MTEADAELAVTALFGYLAGAWTMCWCEPTGIAKLIFPIIGAGIYFCVRLVLA